jgi:hypothetical protein
MKKAEEKKSIDFINKPSRMSELSMKDIFGGTSVLPYVDCPNVHHAPNAVSASRLDVW